MKTKKIVVLTGAGMSAECGFSTFRDSGGLWEKYPVEQVATPEGWNDNPDLVTDFYNGLRKQLADAQPNEGHRLLAKLRSITMWWWLHRMLTTCTSVPAPHE